MMIRLVLQRNIAQLLCRQRVECNAPQGYYVMERRSENQEKASEDGQTKFYDSCANVPSCSLLAALTSKYSDDFSLHDDSLFIVFVPKISPGRTESGMLQIPSNMVLNCSNIYCIGELEDYHISQLHNVTSIDLMCNKIQCWQEVFKLLDNTPQLKYLNLSFNPLEPRVPDRLIEECSFKRLEELTLNGTMTDWISIERLLRKADRLTTLYLNINNYDFIQLSPTFIHDNLETLQLNNSGITDFNQIAKLGRAFPNLRSLTLIGNRLKRLKMKRPLGECFSQLRSWNLSENPLEGWAEIDRLNELPRLVDVKLVDVPFLENVADSELRRKLLVARLTQCTVLNGSRVEALEREHAEREFVRFYANYVVKPPQYGSLVAKHGVLQPLTSINLAPQQFVDVKLCLDERVERLHLDVAQTAKQFKLFVAQQLVGMPPNRFRLLYVDAQMFDVYGYEEIKSSSRCLHSYNFHDGDEIHVELCVVTAS